MNPNLEDGLEELQQKAHAAMQELMFDSALMLWRELAHRHCAPDGRWHLQMAICLAGLEAPEDAAFELETAFCLNDALRSEAAREPELSRPLELLAGL